MTTYSLNDKVVLITGAAGGIGRAMATALYHKGALLVLTDTSLAAVEQLASHYDPDRVLALALDVTDIDATRKVVNTTIKHFGGLDCVLANAGIAWHDAPATIAGSNVDEFEHILAVDLLGVWRTIKACLPEIIRRQGQVLVTASIYAMINGLANAPYAAAKAAIESMARSLRTELAYTGASASIIYPGWVATPIIDIAFGGHVLATRMTQQALPAALRQPITPDKLANAVVRGMEKRRPHIIAPTRWRPLFWLRGMVNPLSDRLLAHNRSLHALIRQLDNSSASANVTTIKTAKSRLTPSRTKDTSQ